MRYDIYIYIYIYLDIYIWYPQAKPAKGDAMLVGLELYRRVAVCVAKSMMGG